MQLLSSKEPEAQHACTFSIADTPIEPGRLDAIHILTPEELAERLKVPVHHRAPLHQGRARKHPKRDEASGNFAQRPCNGERRKTKLST